MDDISSKRGAQAPDNDPEPYPRPSVCRPCCWLVRLGERYLAGRTMHGDPDWTSDIRSARRFDAQWSAARAARWAGGVAVEIGGAR